MGTRLLALFALAVAACGAEKTGPESFYMVSRFFSDDGALVYYRVTDVQRDGAGSRIRYMRIAPRSVYCMREIVQMAEARVPDRTPSQLVSDRNPCKAKDVQHPRNRGGFETFDIAIVARCGDREVTRVWDSPEHVLKSAPGLWETLDDRSIEDDLALQHAGESVIGELRSGRFDKGLAKVERLWKKPSFNAVLSRYTGPVPDNPLVAKLMNASDFRFVQFVAPKYPPLAGHAHVQGKVELRLGVDSATGAVLEAEIAAGHPLFRPAVLDAAKQWRFEPGSTSSAVNAVLEFSLDCR